MDKPDPLAGEPFSSVPRADGSILIRYRGAPVTILRGAHSDLLAPDIADRMVQRIPGAELVTVPGVGHPPLLDEPESVAAIDRLLTRVLAG